MSHLVMRSVAVVAWSIWARTSRKQAEAVHGLCFADVSTHFCLCLRNDSGKESHEHPQHTLDFLSQHGNHSVESNPSPSSNELLARSLVWEKQHFGPYVELILQ